MERMQKVLMAIVCTVLKSTVVADDVNMPLKDLLVHLCRRQIDFEEILRIERRLLQALNFEVTAPSVLEFLDALSVPITVPGESVENGTARCLANFLLQLSLFSAPTHYSHPQAIVAASALYLALATLRAEPAQFRSVLHDVSVACEEIPDVPSRVAECALDLQELWLDFASSRGDRAPCLLKKFGGVRLHEATLLSPPPAGSLPHPSLYLSSNWPSPSAAPKEPSTPTTASSPLSNWPSSPSDDGVPESWLVDLRRTASGFGKADVQLSGRSASPGGRGDAPITSFRDVYTAKGRAAPSATAKARRSGSAARLLGKSVWDC